MDGNTYQKMALKTENPGDEELGLRLMLNSRTINAMQGLAGEVGECNDILKKHIFQGHEFDKTHFMKELGDVAWYLALAADSIGANLDDIFDMNITKLQARYANGKFSKYESVNRKEGDI